MRLVWIGLVGLLVACTNRAPRADGGPVTLALAAYAVAREPYGEGIVPAFRRHWKAENGQDVSFEESYQASGAQARAIRDGFEADLAVLSIESDVVTLEKAGLVTSDWRSGPLGGMASRSVVVIAVRPGNPKGIDDWDDLARPGVAVLTPNVRTSGGAMWNVLALYGAALRGHVPGVAANDPAAAEAFLARVLANVTVMDKAGRESMITFEGGVGDAAITYENEVVVARAAGRAVDYVIPSSTMRIENPAVVVDGWAERHGTVDVARAFVAYLVGPEAQRILAEHGMRPADPGVGGPTFPPVPFPFGIADLGGWDVVNATVFADGAAYDRALAAATR